MLRLIISGAAVAAVLFGLRRRQQRNQESSFGDGLLSPQPGDRPERGVDLGR